VLEAYLPQSASQSYYQFPQSNYTSPAGAQQQSPASPYYQTPAQQGGYGGAQANYGQYGHTQYGFNHSSFGPNNSQANAQYMHTTQSLAPNHPAYLVGDICCSSHDSFNTPFQLSHQQQALNTPHQPTGMFTRNLIGALSASAFRLYDQNEKFGIWFILQDLSIRTDGIFRYVQEPISILAHMTRTS
jgi:Velvet factor